VADTDLQAHHPNQHVPLLLFVRPVAKHPINSTKKKTALPPINKTSFSFDNQHMTLQLFVLMLF
jgi:hypothetical protein